MVRQILVAIDGSECGRAASTYAASLGVRLGAWVEALSVIDVRPLEGPLLRDFTTHLGLEPFETYTQALRDVLQQRADNVLAQFLDDARAVGLGDDCIRIVSEIGMIAETICRHGAASDIIVMGQHGEHPTMTGGLLGSTSEQVARRATCPVMICPPTFRSIDRPLVAYDGSETGEGALHLAADVASLLGTSLSVLVVIDGESITAERAKMLHGRAADYLGPARLAVEYECAEGRPDEGIIAHAREDKHGLIVMGAFGHSRIRELIVGSHTATVMRRSDVPVLLVRRG